MTQIDTHAAARRSLKLSHQTQISGLSTLLRRHGLMPLPGHQPHQLGRREPIALSNGEIEIRAFAVERCHSLRHLGRDTYPKAAIASAPADGSQKAAREASGQPQNFGLLEIHTGDVFSTDMKAIGGRLRDPLLSQHVQCDQLDLLQGVALPLMQRLEALHRQVEVHPVGVWCSQETIESTEGYVALTDK
ncbi:hypothetical protein D9M69_539800 [compost metagenome]